eukprot:351035-Chlamydomonas_euryale.AAC.4
MRGRTQSTARCLSQDKQRRCSVVKQTLTLHSQPKTHDMVGLRRGAVAVARAQRMGHSRAAKFGTAHRCQAVKCPSAAEPQPDSPHAPPPPD